MSTVDAVSDELSVLQAIYGPDFEARPEARTFSVLLLPVSGGTVDDNRCSARVVFTLPLGYPKHDVYVDARGVAVWNGGGGCELPSTSVWGCFSFPACAAAALCPPSRACVRISFATGDCRAACTHAYT